MYEERDKALKTHQPCNDCGSSDALSYYDDHSFCFSCEKYTFYDDRPVIHGEIMQLQEYKEDTPWADRNINPAVCSYYGVQTNGNDVIFPYFDTNGQRIGSKIRRKGKNFTWDTKNSQPARMFGYQTLAKMSKGKADTLVITEGEADALAAFQMINKIRPDATNVSHDRTIVPVISIKSGMQSAIKDIQEHLETLETYKKVYFCFDNEPRAQEIAEKCAKKLSPGKAYIIKLELKDACEYSKAKLPDQFRNHMSEAEQYTPSGIVNAGSNFDGLWAETNLMSIPFPWPKLQAKTLGIRAREITTWAAGTGVGKSSILREMQHFYLKNTEHNIGIIALEESVDRTRKGIMAVEANDRLHLNEVFTKYSKEQIREYYKATLADDRVYIYDHFGSMDVDDLLSRIRYMVQAFDCKIIFIDHLSILVSGLDTVDERRGIDRAMTLLRKLTEETHCCVHLVTHLRRVSGDKSHEDGVEVNLGHLRGSHGIAQISDSVIAMERDTQSDDPIVSNTSTIRVLKCRYTGDVGKADDLLYDKKTGRMEPIILKEEF